MGIETVVGLIVAAGIAVWMHSRERHWKRPESTLSQAEFDEDVSEIERKHNARCEKLIAQERQRLR